LKNKRKKNNDFSNIEKKKENHGFYLATAFRSASFRRVVLKGASSKTGIKLQITYSKMK